MQQAASGFWPFNPHYYVLPSYTSTPASDMSYSSRQLSPGGRRIANQGRVSESAVNNSAYHQRNGSYTSPRSSGVIPISTETFINVPPPSTSRSAERQDSYGGTSRPRRSSLLDQTRASGTTVNQLPVRSRPTVIQADAARSSSPGKSGDARNVSHKKVYSIDDGAARLVADVNVPASTTTDRHHRRRDSDTERSSRRLSDAAKDRGRKSYHTNGYTRPTQPTIDDEDAFSYTDPAGMYRDTEPRWREVRTRRGSLDRAGASRERPVSMLDPSYDPRRSTRDIGPPPSTRGWDRINEGLGRTRSVRDATRDVSQSPSRGRGYTDSGSYADPRDPYYVAPRTSSKDHHLSMPYAERYDDYGYDEPRSPRRSERHNSVTRGDRPDRSVERRGFGIRSDYAGASRDAYARSSDESFEQVKYRDSGYAEPHRHNHTSSDHVPHESRRQDPDQRDRQRERETREKEGRRREGDRSYDRSYDRSRDQEYDIDRERERERARQLDPPPSDHDRDRHYRRDYDRNQDRREYSPRHSSETVSQPGLAQAATGGLAGVAAALGAKSLVNKVMGNKGDKQDRDDRERDRYRDRRSDQADRDDYAYERDQDRDKPRGENDRERDKQREHDRDRGLGFAYENHAASSEASRSAPALTREAGKDHAEKPVGMPAPAVDPNAEYRRRMEQVQRELGGGQQSDDDVDRERRRRERELRQRNGGEDRNGHSPNLSTSDVGLHDTLPPPASRRNLDVDDRSQLTASSGGSSVPSDLRKKPSILDRPLTHEPAEVIDNTQSESRENRVRIVDPPTEEEEKRPKGILKKPTEKFPEDPNVVREGVAPLKDATKKGIPPGARWTKIDRRLVNPEALEKMNERFEERLDCVIVLRVLTKEEIQKLADITKDIRDHRDEDERAERKAARRHDRHRDRHERDEYSDDSENEFKERAPKMLEAPPSSTAGGSSSADSDHVRDSRDRRRDRDHDSNGGYNMSGGLGRRD